MKKLTLLIVLLSALVGSGLAQSTIQNAPYGFDLNGLQFGSGTTLPTACGVALSPAPAVGNGALYWQSPGGGQTGLTGEGWYECLDGAFSQIMNQLNMFGAPHTYAQNAIQFFTVSSTTSDLVVGQVATDPCCSLQVGSLYMVSNGLHGNPHLNFFDGNIGQTNITASDSPCDMSNGCSGVAGSQVALVNSPSFVTPNIGDATGTSLTLNLTTGDFFDQQQGLTTPFIQATPQSGHIKSGYGSDNRFQISNNGAAFSDVILNSDLLPNLQLPLATNVNGGVGLEVGNTTSATQSGSLGSTSLVATSPASTTWYRISFYLFQIAAGTSCTGNTNLKANVIYTDATTNTAQTVQVHAGAVVNNGGANSAIAPLSNSMGSFVFPAHTSTSINYSVTYTIGTGCSPGPTYQVTPLLEKM